MQPVNSCRILGVRLDLVNWQELMAYCQQALEEKQPKQIVTLNGEFILEASKNSTFKQTINQADLVVADSTNVVWVGRLLGYNTKEQTAGSDLTEKLVSLAANLNKTVYFLGSREGIAQKAADILRKRYPGVNIVCSSANPDDPSVLSDIKKAAADIVLVAYGAPRQDNWIAEHKHETGASLHVGIGGTFDMISGSLPRAPHFMRALHLEWLWRLIIQPSRFPRIWKALVVFPLTAIFSRNNNIEN